MGSPPPSRSPFAGFTGGTPTRRLLVVFFAVVAGLFSIPFVLVVLLSGLTPTVLGNSASAANFCDPETGEAVPGTSGSTREIPPRFLALYQRAAKSYGLGWHYLAAIGKVESGHGVNNGPSSAGAKGPMQFMDATWRSYGVDGNKDGKKDVWDEEDAIPAAARYLKASGAPRDWERAIFAYNHWDLYVEKVLAQATSYAAVYGDSPLQPCVADGFPAPKPQDPSGVWPPESPSGPENITPRMRQVRGLIDDNFIVPNGIGCYRPNGGIPGGGEHPLGRACDFMLSSGGRMPTETDISVGFDIALWAQENADKYGIMYVIYRQRIWDIRQQSAGWVQMEDRGSITQNHFDHVHISMF